MSRSLAALLAVALLACGGESTRPADGPLALAIVAGQGQTVRAGDDRLTDPVVGQLVRQANGAVAFRWIRAAGDALIPTAQAQTVVNGSPVPGAVVCAVSVGEPKLIPFTPCTNTDDQGKATFFFSPDTLAGEARAEVRGSVDGSPAVFDTAMAIVTPDSAMYFRLEDPSGHGGSVDDGVPVAVGDSLNLRARMSTVEDRYHNVITDYTLSVAVAPSDLASDSSTWNWHEGDVVHFPEAGDWRAYVMLDGRVNFLWVHVQ